MLDSTGDADLPQGAINDFLSTMANAQRSMAGSQPPTPAIAGSTSQTLDNFDEGQMWMWKI